MWLNKIYVFGNYNKYFNILETILETKTINKIINIILHERLLFYIFITIILMLYIYIIIINKIIIS